MKSNSILFVNFWLVAIAACSILFLGRFSSTEEKIDTDGLEVSATPLDSCVVNSCVKKPTSMPNIYPEISLLPDGIYLYGQSPVSEQILNEYFVFEIRNDKVIGAFYLPHSSFYCFYGTQKLGELDVTVVDSYDNYQSPYNVNLQDYYPLTKPSENDMRIWEICQDNYQHLVW